MLWYVPGRSHLILGRAILSHWDRSVHKLLSLCFSPLSRTIYFACFWVVEIYPIEIAAYTCFWVCASVLFLGSYTLCAWRDRLLYFSAASHVAPYKLTSGMCNQWLHFLSAQVAWRIVILSSEMIAWKTYLHSPAQIRAPTLTTSTTAPTCSHPRNLVVYAASTRLRGSF